MKYICLLLCVLFSITMRSQSTFWTEDFGNGTSCTIDQAVPAGGFTTAKGTWNVSALGTNDPYANRWYISQLEAGRTVGVCGETCLDSSQLINRTLHIGNVLGSPNAVFCPNGDCGAQYDPGVGNNSVRTNTRAESPTINCSGKTGVSLTFDYIMRGDTADFMTVWYFDGATWTSLGLPVATNTCSIATIPGDTEGVWATNAAINLPASANGNAAVKVGFSWKNNDDGLGSNPAAAIDNIVIQASNTGSGPSTLTVTITPPDTVSATPVYCNGIPYNFNGFMTGSPSGWNWEVYPAANVLFNPTLHNQNGEEITFPTVGTYTIVCVGRSINNGTDSATLVINVSATPTVTVTPPNPQVCQGGSGTVLYAAGASSYTWTSAATVNAASYLDPNGDSVNVDPSGSTTGTTTATYSVVGTNTVGCTSLPLPITVTISPAPSFTAVSVSPICAGDSTVLSVNNMPVTTSYTWSAGATPYTAGLGNFYGSFADATPIYHGSIDTTIFYYVDVSLPGCPPYARKTVSVTVKPIPKITVLTDSIGNCNKMGDTLSAQSSPPVGVGFYWSTSPSGTPHLTSLPSDTNKVFVKPTMPTKYYVTPYYGGCAGKPDSVMVSIGDTSNASVTSNLGLVCLGDAITLTAYPQRGQGNTNYSYYYNWGVKTGGGPLNEISHSVNSDTILVRPTTNTTYTVAVGGTCVLHRIAQVSVVVNPGCQAPATSFIASSHSFCLGTGTGNGQPHCVTYTDLTQHTTKGQPLMYYWYFPDSHSITTTSSYTLVGTNKDSLYYNMTDTAKPLKPVVVCYNVNSSLNNSGYYPIIETVISNGDTVRAKDSIQVKQSPSVTLVANQTIDLGNSTTLNASGQGASTYTWVSSTGETVSCANTLCNDPTVTPTVTTEYTVTVSSLNGCSDDAVTTVIVIEICKDVFVANAFSPNGDGTNDVLHVKSNCLTNFSFKIFDRWGEKVFESTDLNYGWDGTFRNKALDTGVFAYTLDGFLSNGKEVKQKGNVSLMR